MAIEGILSQLGYPNRRRVQSDVKGLQKKFPALTPKASTHIHNDGSESFLLMLEGTIPIVYKGATYNIPIEVIVSEAYPSSAPLCFVRPVKGMEVKRDHAHVSVDGRVHLPYLSTWRSEHTLVVLAESMVAAFSLKPPVFAVRQGSQQLQQQQQQQRPPPPYEASPLAAGGASSGNGSAQEQLSAGVGDPVRAELVRKVTEKLRRHLETFVSEGKKEIEEEYRRRARLEAKRQTVDAQIAGLTKHKNEVEAALAAAVSANAELDTWLEERRIEDEAKAAAEAAAATATAADGTTGGGAVESLPVQPADPLSAKLLELVAESCAIEDTLYALDRGLMRECLSVGEFMKQVRALTRQQFFVQAHIQKVHRAQKEHQRKSRMYGK